MEVSSYSSAYDVETRYSENQHAKWYYMFSPARWQRQYGEAVNTNKHES